MRLLFEHHIIPSDDWELQRRPECRFELSHHIIPSDDWELQPAHAPLQGHIIISYQVMTGNYSQGRVHGYEAESYHTK